MNSLLKVWKKQVKSSSLVRILRIYWKVFFNEERRTIACRAERLCFLKQLIKKKLPKRIIPFKVWFFGVEQKEIFNPFLFVDDEKYLETLIIWKKREMKKVISDNPRLSIKGYRHEKIYKYRRTLRV